MFIILKHVVKNQGKGSLECLLMCTQMLKALYKVNKTFVEEHCFSSPGDGKATLAHC